MEEKIDSSRYIYYWKQYLKYPSHGEKQKASSLN